MNRCLVIVEHVDVLPRAVDHRKFRRQVGDGVGVHAAGDGHVARIAVDDAGLFRERHIDVAAAVDGALAGLATVIRTGQTRVGLARCRLDHLELDLLTVDVAESHLQLAVDRQQLDLVGDVGEEQHSDIAGGNLAEVGIELAANADVIRGEVQFADDQELAVGAEAYHHLTVEDLLRGIDGEDLGAAGDQHRRGESRGETVHAGVRLYHPVLGHDLLLDGCQPLVGGLAGRQAEFGAAQLFGVLNRRQGLKELNAG